MLGWFKVKTQPLFVFCFFFWGGAGGSIERPARFAFFEKL